MTVHYIRYVEKKGTELLDVRTLCGNPSKTVTFVQDEVTCRECRRRINKENLALILKRKQTMKKAP